MDEFNKYLYLEIGKKLKASRLNKGLNQNQLAEEISGIGRTSISNLEQGKQQPPLHILYQICHTLDMDIQSILPTYREIDLLITENENNLKNQLKSYDFKDKTKENISDFLSEIFSEPK